MRMKIGKLEHDGWCYVINGNPILVNAGRLENPEKPCIDVTGSFGLVEGEYVKTHQIHSIPNAMWSMGTERGELYAKLEEGKLKFKIVGGDSVYYFKQYVSLSEDGYSIEVEDDLSVFTNHMEYNDEGDCNRGKVFMKFTRDDLGVVVDIDDEEEEVSIIDATLGDVTKSISHGILEGEPLTKTNVKVTDGYRGIDGELYITLHKGKIRCAIDMNEGFRYLRPAM